MSLKNPGEKIVPIFDIFYRGSLQELDEYAQLKEDLERYEAMIDYIREDGVIRIYYSGKFILEILARAHVWAHKNNLDHDIR